MRLVRQIIFLIALLIALPSFAATREETHAFNNATKVFSDRIFYLAERDFTAFLDKYPASEHRSEAILFTAKARYYQTNYAGAIELLTKQLPQAGPLLDQYYFWIGESHFANGSFDAAAKSYRELLHSLQQSSLRLEAAYNEALCYSKLKNWPRVIDLLGKLDGDFQVASKPRAESDFALNGSLLLAEALAAQNEFTRAESVLVLLNERKLSPLNKWRRDFLAAKILLAQSRLEGALQASTNLIEFASRVGDRNVVAESISLQGEILERLNRLPEAIDAHEKNLVEGLPTETRRRALYKSIELTLRQGKVAEASRKLQSFIDQNPRDPAIDVALLSLGELLLRQHFDLINGTTNTIAVAQQTNLIEQAFTNFTTIQTNFPQSQVYGKALLDIGWCYWTQNEIDEAEKAFAEAAKALPVSEDKAVAIFKRADCQFSKQDFANAAANYDIVVENFGNLEAVKQVLVDQALYQIVKAGIAVTNQAIADSAAKKILALYPNSFFADRTLLLFGQGLNRQGDPAKARETFTALIVRFPNSSLRAEAELAVARTYVQEKQWAAAIAKFETWETMHANHPLIPEATFARALASAQAGRETNALTLLTNLVVRFPTNSLAARAESWIGDYYFNAEEYPKAEAHYQEVLKHNPSPELLYQAYLMAGRAAYERQGYDEARKNYLEPLISNTNTPNEILVEAFFALGDTSYAQFLATTNEESLGDAISALKKIVEKYSTNSPIAGRAWGRLGDFYMQSALLKTNATELAKARDAYENAINLKATDASCRNLARLALGKVFEKQGDVMAALDAYESVVNDAYDENADPFCVKEAGLAVGKILESRGEWASAAVFYDRLSKLPILSALKPALDKKAMLAKANEITPPGVK